LELGSDGSRDGDPAGDGVLIDTCETSGPTVEDDGDSLDAQDVSDAGKVSAPLPRQRRRP